MIAGRLEEELGLLRAAFHRVEHVPDGQWVLVEPVLVPEGWSLEEIPCSFRIPVGYPGTPPYGFYTPRSLQPVCGSTPGSYQAEPNPLPPFDGAWSMFSWAHAGAGWHAGPDVRTGSNLLNYVRSFGDRLREGA